MDWSMFLSCYKGCGAYVNDSDQLVKHISDIH